MKLLIILVPLIAILFSPHCIAQIVAQPTKIKNTFEAETKHGNFYVQLESTVVYVFKAGKTEVSRFVGTGLRKDGVDIKEVGGFFDLKPKPVKVRLGKSQEYETSESRGSTTLGFRNAGNINVVLELGDELIHVPITVVQLPYAKGDESDLIISDLGIPITSKTHYIKWPTNEFIDGAFYSVSAQESIYSVEHWRFAQYPHCVFSIRDDKLFLIHSKYTPEPELPKRAQVVRPDKKPLESFTMADGKTILMATFLDFKRAQVYLKNANGETLQFKLADFDGASSARIRELFKQQPPDKKSPGKK